MYHFLSYFLFFYFFIFNILKLLKKCHLKKNYQNLVVKIYCAYITLI